MYSPPPKATGQNELNTLFSSLAHRDRRAVLGKLYEHEPEPLTVRDLAVALSEPGSRTKNDATQQAIVTLEHTHLPNLADAELIEWQEACNVVHSVEHEVIRTMDIYDALFDSQSAETESLDALFRSLADTRCRITLAILQQETRPVELDTLAQKIRVVEQATDERNKSTSKKQLMTILHHAHLPRLDDVGLISYDSEEHVVEYEGHLLLDSSDSLSSLVLPSV